MLRLEQVGIRFGDAPPAVKDVSLQVNPQDKLLVIGETGSGKSVLLLAVLRLLPASASVTGKIVYGGQNLLDLPSKAMTGIRGRQLSYIPQGSGNGLNPLYTVGHQICEALQKQKKRSKKQAMREAAGLLEQFGMEEPRRVCASYPFMLSGGMRQRALIAMGIAADAQMILADEPTKGLDAGRIDMVVEAFQQLQDRTLLCVTHDLRFAQRVASRIVVMYASQQVESADSAAFFSRPLHPYSQAMLDALPENGMKANMGFAPPRKDETAQQGCHFCDRCAYYTERCRQPPPMVELGDRKVRCWKYAAST